MGLSGWQKAYKSHDFTCMELFRALPVDPEPTLLLSWSCRETRAFCPSLCSLPPSHYQPLLLIRPALQDSFGLWPHANCPSWFSTKLREDSIHLPFYFLLVREALDARNTHHAWFLIGRKTDTSPHFSLDSLILRSSAAIPVSNYESLSSNYLQTICLHVGVTMLSL